MGIYSIARRHSATLMIAAVGFIAMSQATMAQNAPASQNAPAAQPMDQNAPEAQQPQLSPSEEVAVSAPARELVQRSVGPSRTVSRLEDVTVTHEIGFNDLDLSKSSDVDELNRRVQAAAEASCSELDQLFPGTRSRRTSRDCVNRAVAAARAQVTAAISRSGGRYGSETRP